MRLFLRILYPWLALWWLRVQGCLIVNRLDCDGCGKPIEGKNYVEKRDYYTVKIDDAGPATGKCQLWRDCGTESSELRHFHSIECAATFFLILLGKTQRHVEPVAGVSQ